MRLCQQIMILKKCHFRANTGPVPCLQAQCNENPSLLLLVSCWTTTRHQQQPLPSGIFSNDTHLRWLVKQWRSLSKRKSNKPEREICTMKKHHTALIWSLISQISLNMALSFVLVQVNTTCM